MVVIVELVADAGERPPAGSRVRVEVRDTSLADAPSVTVAAAEAEVRGRLGTWLDTIELDVEEADGLTVWAHVDVDGDGTVSDGDYITQASFPVPAGGESRVTVTLRPI